VDATKARNGQEEPPMNTDDRADVSEGTICTTSVQDCRFREDVIPRSGATRNLICRAAHGLPRPAEGMRFLAACGFVAADAGGGPDEVRLTGMAEAGYAAHSAARRGPVGPRVQPASHALSGACILASFRLSDSTPAPYRQQGRA